MANFETYSLKRKDIRAAVSLVNTIHPQTATLEEGEQDSEEFNKRLPNGRFHVQYSSRSEEETYTYFESERIEKPIYKEKEVAFHGEGTPTGADYYPPETQQIQVGSKTVIVQTEKEGIRKIRKHSLSIRMSYESRPDEVIQAVLNNPEIPDDIKWPFEALYLGLRGTDFEYANRPVYRDLASTLKTAESKLNSSGSESIIANRILAVVSFGQLDRDDATQLLEDLGFAIEPIKAAVDLAREKWGISQTPQIYSKITSGRLDRETAYQLLLDLGLPEHKAVKLAEEGWSTWVADQTESILNQVLRGELDQNAATKGLVKLGIEEDIAHDKARESYRLRRKKRNQEILPRILLAIAICLLFSIIVFKLCAT